MSIHGILGWVERLSDHLWVAMDSGARQVMIPTANAADLGIIPTELLDKIRIECFSEPIQTAYKAIAET
jgi:ATP-dependent Lon protease